MTTTFRDLVVAEKAKAYGKHAPMNSLHEAYSVLLEEVDEFWDEVKKKSSERDHENILTELVQIATMAERAAEDLRYVEASPLPADADSFYKEKYNELQEAVKAFLETAQEFKLTTRVQLGQTSEELPLSRTAVMVDKERLDILNDILSA